MSDSDDFSDADNFGDDNFGDDNRDDVPDRDDFEDRNQFDRESDVHSYGGRPYKPPGMSGCAKVAVGCGILSLLAMIGVGLTLWWIAANARDFGADLAGTAMKEGLKQLQLPDDQQQRIFARIDEVSQKFKDEEITLEEVGQIFQKISQGPLIPAGMALVVERAYLDDSGFDEDEKTAARVAIQRFTHGAIRKMIPEDEVNRVLDTISTRKGRDQREFRHPITDEELRSFVSAAKEAADTAEVPAEVPEVNFADEFDKAIDDALGTATPGDSAEVEEAA